MSGRSPTTDEARLLAELARIAGIEHPEAWVENLRVQEMDDGGMGSLEFDVPKILPGGRYAAHYRAAVQFTDADGVPVIASLVVREDGVPFELDIWKVDSNGLIRIPYEFQRTE